MLVAVFLRARFNMLRVCAFYTKFEGLFKFFLQSIDTFMCACVLFTIISFVVSAQCFQHSK